MVKILQRGKCQPHIGPIKLSGDMTKFESYCNRMWVDYCDENDDWKSVPTRLDLEDYKRTYHDWLFDKFINEKAS